MGKTKLRPELQRAISELAQQVALQVSYELDEVSPEGTKVDLDTGLKTMFNAAAYAVGITTMEIGIYTLQSMQWDLSDQEGTGERLRDLAEVILAKAEDKIPEFQVHCYKMEGKDKDVDIALKEFKARHPHSTHTSVHNHSFKADETHIAEEVKNWE